MATRTMYEIEIRHDGLNKYRHIRGSDRYVVIQKAEAQKRAWDEMWESRQETARKNQARVDAATQKEMMRQLAVEKTEEAQAELDSLRNTLRYTLDINDAIDWNSLKDQSKCPPPPILKKVSAPVQLETYPEPVRSFAKYQPKIGLLEKLIPPLKREAIAKSESLFSTDHLSWQNAKRETEVKNTLKQKDYELKVAQANAEHEKNLADYEIAKADFLKNQHVANASIDQKKVAYLNLEQGAVIDYCEMVLANSKYPETFPKEFDIEYLVDTKMLLVDYALPSLEQVPSLKEIKYIQTKNEFKEVYLSDKELDAIYDDLIYQISLRTLHELFEADVAKAIDAIVFNGLVTSIDKANGNTVTTCIVSLQAGKDEFLPINLAKIDPKSCFKSLKGVGSSKLHSMTAVPPILMINKEDRRFVSSYGVADRLDDSTNLAMMDWEDFEHLIRELFEKEFKQNGGEVKVTQASRDGGVDAVAFDPDPIRGGKIVIQAKRYANTVGVSAVRDLYGTVMNEGATKGILVSTANYGPDAYDFAKGKPLTLLNGANLLHLLEKHGHRAKIDLNEARQILAANQAR